MTLPTHTFKQSFRDAMASCASGVHVITTDGAAGRYGITMTAVTSVTDEPPTMMLCINREAGIIPILLANRDLCINTLSHKHHIWNRGQNGQLEVEGALAQLHGSIIAQKEMGTHFVFFAQINEIKTLNTRSPALLYFRRSFRSLD